MDKEFEIPFGAKDSELKGWEYTIPEGMEAEIKEGKIIVREKESEDERIIGRIKKAIESYWSDEPLDEILAWLEKQGQHKPVISDEAIREGVAHFGITQYQISNWLKKYIDIEKQGSQNLANSAKTCKVEQNPAWSGEDEKNLYLITTAVEHKYSGELFLGKKQKEIVRTGRVLLDWLYSLKERYTWKPSDKQMEALKVNVDRLIMQYPGYEIVLKSLYDDLRKLKG